MASVISAGTTSGTSLNLSGDTSGVLQLASNGSTTAVTIDTSQNVGIGMTNQTKKLETTGTLATRGSSTNTTWTGAGELAIKNGSGNAYMSFHGDTGTRLSYMQTSSSATELNAETGYLAFSTNAERMRITSAGLVAIGTSTTAGRVTIAAPAATTNDLVLNGSTTSGVWTQYSNSSGSFYVGLDSSTGGGFGSAYSANLYHGGPYPMVFWTNAAERMRITSSGNVLVGTTSFVYTAAGTQVNGGQINIGSAGTGGSTLMNFGNGNGAVGSITVTGSSTSYNINSDYRLKENIAPMTGALATVAQLKPVTYKWKADGSDGQGFIAHELQAVVPDCVTGEKDAVETYTDEDGNEQTRPKYQGIDTSFLVATLTAAIQELKAELDATKAEVQALKGVA